MVKRQLMTPCALLFLKARTSEQNSTDNGNTQGPKARKVLDIMLAI